MVQRKHAQGVADRRVDVLVMSRFAANDTAETHNGIPAISFQHPLSRQGDFPGSGNPRRKDVGFRDSHFMQSFDRAFEQLAGNVAVVAGDNDADAASGNEFRFAEFPLVLVDRHGSRFELRVWQIDKDKKKAQV